VSFLKSSRGFVSTLSNVLMSILPAGLVKVYGTSGDVIFTVFVGFMIFTFDSLVMLIPFEVLTLVVVAMI
jgi:hypothetical protein